MKFIHPDLSLILRREGLRSFEDLWALDRNWFEPPNVRRGGTSGVCYQEWTNPAGGADGFFIKFQENHCRRTLKHPMHGVPTAGREAKNLLYLGGKGFPVPKLVYYEERVKGTNRRSILITRKLDGKSLDLWLRNSPLDPPLAAKIAELVFRLNKQLGYEHRQLSLKHIWINEGGLALIDLEHAVRRRWSLHSFSHDLQTLLLSFQRKGQGARKAKVSKTQSLEILTHYLGLAGRMSHLERLSSRLGLNSIRASVDGFRGEAQSRAD